MANSVRVMHCGEKSLHCVGVGGVFTLVMVFSLGIGVRAMDDQTLLSRYAVTQEASAFEELVQRHAGLVKAACIRVLGNSHDAEEVAQECFLELAHHADQIHTSVAGWLHRAATSRSLNVLRSRSRRKVREREVGIHLETSASVTDITTPELQRIIDSGLKDLPEDLRLPMILHFFDGRSQREVAIELGVNQSTISRRMHDALQQLREKLSQAGYAAAAPAMMFMTREKSSFAASESAVTKITTSSATDKAVGSTTLVSFLKFLGTASLPIISFLVFDGWISLLIAVCLTTYVARYRPHWVQDLFSSLGLPDVYNQPMYFLGRWDWTTPPDGWRVHALSTFIWSVLFMGISLAFTVGSDPAPWGTVVLAAVVAIAFGIHSSRIFYRVCSISKRHRINIGEIPSTESKNELDSFWDQFIGLKSNDPTLSWYDAVQLIGLGLASVELASQLVIDPQAKPIWSSVVLAGLVGLGMLATGVSLCRRWLNFPRKSEVSVASIRLREKQSPGSATASRSQHWAWTGTQSVLTTGVTIVVALSAWIVWNPAAVRGLSLSLAAIQTSMLGWIVYRLAAHCQHLKFSLVRRVALIVLVCCFVLNSGVCLANWLR